MPSVRTFRVVPNLPDRLLPLGILARNLWWTWTPDAADLPADCPLPWLDLDDHDAVAAFILEKTGL